MQKEVHESLVMLGFTEYEAKAYAALVGLGMGTAREVHDISGVPHGRIYSVLKTLAEKGYVTVQKGSPTYFRAEDPEIVIGGLRVRLNEKVDRSLAHLKSLRIETGHPLPFWSIHSEWGINRRIRSMIENAKKEIIIFFMDSSSLFPFMKEIQAAEKRIRVSVVSLNEEDRGEGLPLEVHVPNERLREYLNKMKESHVTRAEHLSQPEFLLFADGKESLILEQASGGDVATVIMAPELTFMMRSFIVAFDPRLGCGEDIF
jgi:sugar-specific transcriptional regulator TrmB